MIPSEYIVTKINQYTKRPTKLRYRNAYNFECPVCGEGSSSGRKKRGFYMENEGYFYCHNCNQGWSPIKWIQIVCNMTYAEIMEEIKDFGYSANDIITQFNPTDKKKLTFSTLPDDSINLLDPSQIKYYKNERVVQLCLDLIKTRRLNTAINHPTQLYISLKDKVHKNRLCIPFHDEDNQITFYQTRSILPEDQKDNKPKYLSKLNADKRIYGINNINSNIDELFIFEGPIDSMFVQNGLGICGLQFTELQQQIMQKYSLYQRIWVLDNQQNDKAGKEKTIDLLEQGETVFIWPKELIKFKDINEVCIYYKMDQISHKFIMNNSFNGFEAQTRLNMAKVI